MHLSATFCIEYFSKGKVWEHFIQRRRTLMETLVNCRLLFLPHCGHVRISL